MKTKAIFYSIITICLISFNLNTALAGDIVWEIFKNKTSYDFSKLKATDTIPDQIIKLDSLKTPDNATSLDHFSSRIRGYLIPTVSGEYSFYFACDNVGQFWLSSDANPSNAILKSEILLAQTDWNKNITTQQLIAGQKYFFEILHYDSVYTDLVKLGWKIPGASNPIAIKSTYITSNGDNVPINKLLFPDNTITAFSNWTITPRYQILPWNASNKEIQWISSNTAVATVDAKGVIHTLIPGECQIIGKSAENASITSTLQLTVTNYYGPYFVKPYGNGQGKSWDDAISLTVLLDMLNQGTLPQKINIYLAKGIYKPTNTNDRYKSFILNSVKVIRMLGGYDSASSGKDTTKRDIINNETILSGDIGIQGESIDNSYHVLTILNSAVIDGITIIDGRASCSTYGWTPGIYFFKREDNGGGIYIRSNMNYATTINLNHCKITSNSAWNGGGGMFISGDWFDKKVNIYINNCDFSHNLMQQQTTITGGGIFSITVNAQGAGIFNGGGELFVNNSIFYNNSTAFGYGKAILVANGSVTIDRCSFYNNIGYYEDLWAKDGSTLNLNNSTVVGSIVSFWLSKINIKNSTIIGRGYVGGEGAKVNLDNSIWTNMKFSQMPDTNLVSAKYSIINNFLYGSSKNKIIYDKVPLSTVWLDSISNNGGLTPTVKLKDLPDNPAITNGNPLYLGTMDQRGVVRSDKVSIGAYQWVKTTGIETTEFSESVKVYPNPVADELIIEFAGNTQNTDFEVINSLGQVVSSGVLFGKISISTASFITGIYLVKLKSGNTVELKKIIKN